MTEKKKDRALNNRQIVFANRLIETIMRENWGMSDEEVRDAIAYAVKKALK
jgi:hypothetical protein